MPLSLFPESSKLELLHPITKEPTGFVLEIVDADHDDVYDARMAVTKMAKSKGVKDVAELLYSLDMLTTVAASAIVGWTNSSEEFKKVFAKLGFEDDSFSTEKALALLSMRNAKWIRDQLDTALADKKRFFESVAND